MRGICLCFFNYLYIFLLKSFRSSPPFSSNEQTASIGVDFRLVNLCLILALMNKMRAGDYEVLLSEMATYPSDFRVVLSKELTGILLTYNSGVTF